MSDDMYKPKMPARVRKPGESHQYISSLDGGHGERKLPKPLNNSAPPDITSQLAAKLRAVQEENSRYKELLRRANDENRTLREQLEAVALGSPGREAMRRDLVQEQQQYIKTLERQLSTLESYLAKKGLVYVEDDNDDNNIIPPPKEDLLRQQLVIQDQMKQIREEEYKPPLHDKIKEQIDKLNRITGTGSELVQLSNKKFGFKERTAVPVRFYKDGIYVGPGPFRSYKVDLSARRFVDDIACGYLPTEWRDRYPDGVSIQASFQDHEFKGVAQEDTQFKGKAHQFGFQEPPSVPYPDEAAEIHFKNQDSQTTAYQAEKLQRLKDEEAIKAQTKLDQQLIRGNFRFLAPSSGNSNVHNVMDPDYAHRRQTADEFLKKLPEKKYVNGRVIDVRAAVAKDLGVGGDKVVDLGKTLYINDDEDEEENIDKQEIDKYDQNKATLRIMLSTQDSKMQNRNVVIRMQPHKDLKTLYEVLGKAIGAVPGQMKIMKMTGKQFPPSDNTLAEVGLVPNARLVCQIVGELQPTNK